MAVVVDSSVLIAALHREDALHNRGIRALENAELPIIVPEYIAVETIGVLTGRNHKDSAAVCIKTLAENRTLTFMPSTLALFAEAARYFLSTSKRLSFIDCALAVLAREYDVLTFDKVLAKTIRQEKRKL